MSEHIRETELAFQIADRIISIQECDEGYDYSIMDKSYREIDGGIYDNPDISIREALKDIVDDLKENPDFNGAKGSITTEDELVPLDYDEVREEYDRVNSFGPAVYDSQLVMNFKARTEECFAPIDGMDAAEIEEMVADFIETKFMEYDVSADIRDVVISGSRCRGLEGKQSDLDMVVEFKGDFREDFLFDILHEDGFSIGGVPVDINPITKNKTGTLEDYLPGVEKYLEEKLQKKSVLEKLNEKKASVKEQVKKIQPERKGKLEVSL